MVFPGTRGLIGSPIAMLTASGAIASPASVPPQAVRTRRPAVTEATRWRLRLREVMWAFPGPQEPLGRAPRDGRGTHREVGYVPSDVGRPGQEVKSDQPRVTSER